MPYFWIIADEGFHHRYAFLRVQINYAYAGLAQPIEPAGKRPALAHYQSADSELAD